MNNLKHLVTLVVALFTWAVADAQNGCINPGACNFDPFATVDDGSCLWSIDCAGNCGGTYVADDCENCFDPNNSGEEQFQYSGSIQYWVVPEDVSQITIEAFGAQGGSGNGGSGGLGARIQSTISVAPGETLSILVGGQGQSQSTRPAGGGGSFIVRSDNTPLVVAGGGGAVINSPNGNEHGQITENGSSGFSPCCSNNYGLGGINGNGATNFSGGPCAGNGGGFLTDGEITGCIGANARGRGFLNGGAGGVGGCGSELGGFGGGGGGGCDGAGGGGGYSGGGASYSNGGYGGGGGSYAASTMDVAESGVQSGNGLVVITYSTTPLCVPGCTDPEGDQYDPEANYNNGSCTYDLGCIDPTACNYDVVATIDDGTCEYVIDCAGTCGGTFFLDACGNCYDPNVENNLNYAYSGSIETWTVPADGIYFIEAAGAEGGTVNANNIGGLGAVMKGEFFLTAGTQVHILVGQKGLAPSNVSNEGGGGGGGTFVAFGADYQSSTPLIVAGGGGGGTASYQNVNQPGEGGQTTNTGPIGGDTGDYCDNGGAGFSGNSTCSGNARSFTNGGQGGASNYSGNGGFGGGGASIHHPGGGGGGYSGGRGGYNFSTTARGGGSYNDGDNQENLASTNVGNGYVIIQYNNIPVCIEGCTDPLACNFNPDAQADDSSCTLPDGCVDPTACNFDANALCDNGTCTYPGCEDVGACNFDPNAACDDGSCIFFVDCAGTCGGTFVLDECSNCYDPIGVEAFEFDFTGNIQQWVVPAGIAEVTIEVFGAQGGGGGGYNSLIGGLGARMKGTFTVTSGQTVDILVGQKGFTGAAVSDPQGNENGGGGGSFVVLNGVNTPWIIAGGGGGGPSTQFGTSCSRDITFAHGKVSENGSDTQSCNGIGSGGTSGNGGTRTGSYSGGAGGGFFSNGQNGQAHCGTPFGGTSYLSGGAGGNSNSCYSNNNARGGFGGGGAGELGSPGGGGGYSGGGASGNWSSFSTYGGGGGSYNVGINQDNESGAREGNGYVIITYSTIPECIAGCMDMAACNYNPEAQVEDGSCFYPDGCIDPTACNFDANALCDNGTCTYPGCVDAGACNYDPNAACDDGSCIFIVDCAGLCGGPYILDDCENCYDPAQMVEAFEFNYTGSLQTWTVPEGVTEIEIEVLGAQGGGGGGFNSLPGGLGARMKGTFSVTPGQSFDILVGQKGQTGAETSDPNGNENGGGGGSFVVLNGPNTPYIIAGGGGGGPSTQSGFNCARDIEFAHGQITENGATISCWSTGNGGTSGGGGTTAGSYQGGAGGGFTGNGSSGGSHCCTSGGGASYVNGAAGGNGNCCYGSNNRGGYGGGGGGQLGGPGGGGGYSGGGTAANWDTYSTYGGGGGSYSIGTNQDNLAGVQEGNGMVVISYTTIPVCVPGCTDALADNYVADANYDDGSCRYDLGCMDVSACNFDPTANEDDGSCAYIIDCAGTCGGNFVLDACGNCFEGGVTGDVVFSYTGTIETWIVPEGVTEITIDAFGAQGGTGNGGQGGRGARIQGSVAVTPGQTLKILVGGAGQNSSLQPAGGGGSFVATNDNNPLLVAGGGGAVINSANGNEHGRTVENGNNGFSPCCGSNYGQGGTNGNGATNFSGGPCAGNGGGFFSDGQEPSCASGNTRGKGFVNGGQGGVGSCGGEVGGIGGGGGGGCNGAGGGGGYSGGGASYADGGYGGGGGSFVAGTTLLAESGVQTGNGSINITYGSAPSCIEGCTDPTACNYDANADLEDGSCILPDGNVYLECPDDISIMGEEGQTGVVVNYDMPLLFGICDEFSNGAGLADLPAVFSANYATLLSQLGSTYNFSYDGGANAINDGGGDMYDGGNYLNTNYSSNFNYTSGTVVQGGQFGPSGAYFTQQLPGMFILAADMDNVSHFEITGNLGADGSGSATGYSITSGDYTGFYKRVCSAGDPSVNQLMIVETSVGANQTWSTNTDNNQHRVQNTNTATRIYYILWAGQSGFCYGEPAVQTLMNNFIGILPQGNPSLIAGETSGSEFPAGTTTVTWQFEGSDGNFYDCSFDVIVDIPGWGCTDVTACNYDPAAQFDNGSCIGGGCLDEQACNYDPNAPCDNGSCIFVVDCAGICGGTYVLDGCGNCYDSEGMALEQFDYSGNIQQWIVPAGVTEVTIEVFGAQGGGGGGFNSLPGGLGARMQGTFAVTPGQTLDILVGEKGRTGAVSSDPHGNENGGGGGSFVVLNGDNTPLIIAGGGGGGPATSYGNNCSRDISFGHGKMTENGGDTQNCNGVGFGGTAGNGGSRTGSISGAAGGGFFTNGQNGQAHCNTPIGGQSYLNGGAGGTSNSCYSGNNARGGFGGGGAGELGSPGGGGGYSGGGASGTWSSFSTYGGGGGSYNVGLEQDNQGGAREGDGVVIISYPITPDCEPGCTDPLADNYDAIANFDDGSCRYDLGCMDANACNYDDTAAEDDGSCLYIDCAGVCGGDFTLDACGNCYSSGGVTGEVVFDYSGTIVTWTVPSGVTEISIEALGAQGGNGQGIGGLGARIRGTVSVTPGDNLKILVGQRPSGNGGGGGSFVGTSIDEPLVVAGGGGGGAGNCCGTVHDGGPGLTTEQGGNGINNSGTIGAGGTGGNGGSIYNSGSSAGGGGFYSNGQTASSSNSQGGFAFVNGGSGGTTQNFGGFGGGGSSLCQGTPPSGCAGGGGGGYSGGGGSEGGSQWGAGGGGGSFVAGVVEIAESGVQTGNGQIIIYYDATPICIEDCTDPSACNFNPEADIDNGSCFYPDGCIDPTACNYDANALCDNGSCTYPGCVDAGACNFDPNAACDDGSCIFIIDCAGTCGGTFIEDACGNCYDPNSMGEETFTYTGSLQNWTVPEGVTSITIEVFGAQGGGGGGFNSLPGGLGARMKGTFNVVPGESFNILVGEKGLTGAQVSDPQGHENGGGGGSFVVRADNTPYIIAGGGGGGPATDYGFSCSRDVTVAHGQITEAGSSVSCLYNVNGGSGGNGGGATGYMTGGAGGGFFSNGSNGGNHCCTSIGGQAYLNGAAGGSGNCCYANNNRGGYGGGGGGQLGGPGAGGGYSGGATAADWSSWGSYGGGGGSYNTGTNQENLSGAQEGNGFVIITYDLVPVCVEGCVDMSACNFDPEADVDNGSCFYPDGCIDPTACNFDVNANCDNGTCTYPGCTDLGACNFDPNAACEDGSCIYVIDCAGTCGGTFIEDACGNCYDPTAVFDSGNAQFAFSGGEQTFVVPNGVTELTLECYGAEGQSSNAGRGGYATGQINVTPGQTLYIYVGGQSGYNGGGTGASNRNGGGASDIRFGGNSLQDRIIVAGGGGGASDYGPGGHGGAGQICPEGAAGLAGVCQGCGGGAGSGGDGSCDGGGNGGNSNGGWASGAGGAGMTAGGAGSPSGGYGSNGTSGTLGQGGNRGSSNCGCSSGAGGGGGYYGGGGSADGCCNPGGGGGGSSYFGGVSNGSTQGGVQSSNGLVVIEWQIDLTPVCIEDCTDPAACNFNPDAQVDNGSCFYPDGCIDPTACNFDVNANCDNGTCTYPGCTDLGACNFDPNAACEDGSCIYVIDCAGTCGGTFLEDACGNCYDPETQVEPISFNFSGNIQTWMVPEGVTEITINAIGAQGGNSSYGVGGLGARMQGKVTVTPGEELQILVGEQGLGTSDGAGGGGGSFIVRSSDGTPLMVAGGGGGAGGYAETIPGDNQDGANASTNESGSNGKPSSGEYFIADGIGGINGEGGTSGVSHRPGAGGGGFYTNGTAYTGCHGGCGNGEPGSAYISGSNYGLGEYGNSNRRGGFGGGAGGALGGGGGGGYSGGGGGTWSGYSNADWGHGGGGGGSFNTGINQVAEEGFGSGNGSVTITYSTTPVCIEDCTDPAACNFNPDAQVDNGSCFYPDGCIDPTACNFDVNANCDNGTCTYPGCNDGAACNFDPNAACDDGSCIFFVDCAGNCGGPFVLDDCENCYNPADQFESLEFTYTGSLQQWSVPEGVSEITIEVRGAQGGGGGNNSLSGGLGARMAGTFAVSSGETFNILVGQKGQTGADSSDPHGNENGGGGGSFVVLNGPNTPYIVAGGGGGGPSTTNSLGCPRDISIGHGQITEQGATVTCNWTASGGSNGNGGSTAGGSEHGGAGAGFFGNGSNGGTHCCTGVGGTSYVNGAAGGTGNCCYGSNNRGGYGGGGGGNLGGPGGGGGYSGGAAAGGWSSFATYGGGGGSYNIGTNQDNLAGFQEGNGYVIISYQTIPLCTPGCDDPMADNYDSEVNYNNGSCIYLGCIDPAACNFDSDANTDDGSCIFFIDCAGVCGGSSIVDDCGNCYDPTQAGQSYIFPYTGFLQTFVVPDGVGQIYVEVLGASGGSWNGETGGLGAKVAGMLDVQPGQQMKLLVGAAGQNGDGQFRYAGGGGGSFVTDNANSPILIAGGGGGVSGGPTNANMHASTVETGNDGYSPNGILFYGVGGSAGNGAINAATGEACGGNGGGLLTDGEEALCANQGTETSGSAFVNGGNGGVSACGAGIAGGYGGGGGGGCHGAGGGGGYSGGGGSYGIGGNGGGGGSFNAALDALNLAQANAGNGYIVITLQPTPLCVPGCTDPMADNFDPQANFDDGSCTTSGCTDPAAANYNANATSENGSCQYPGCTYVAASNYDMNANVDDGSCVFGDCPADLGCTDPTACNFNPLADLEDGSCEYASCAACTDANACNYNPLATVDNGSCLYADVCGNCGGTATAGCTNANACNFDPAAGCDDGSCEFDSCAGCTDPVASNYNAASTIEDGSCDYCDASIQYDVTGPDPIMIGSGISNNHMTFAESCDVSASMKAMLRFVGDVVPQNNVYRVAAGESPTSGGDPTPDAGVARWNYLISVNLGDHNFNEVDVILDIDFDPTLASGNSFAANYSIVMADQGLANTALVQDYQNLGFDFWQALGDPAVLPFDPFANGQYDFTLRVVSSAGHELISLPMVVEVFTPGCMDAAACNYNPQASEDDGSCEIAGCTDMAACNYNVNAVCDDATCEFISCTGCTDAAACNYNANAIIDDASCEFVSCAGCTDVNACNYNADATIEDDSCDYGCIGCTYATANNFNANATIDDGSCTFGASEISCGFGTFWDPVTETCVAFTDCPADLNGDGIVNSADLLAFLGAFGTLCN